MTRLESRGTCDVYTLLSAVLRLRKCDLDDEPKLYSTLVSARQRFTESVDPPPNPRANGQAAGGGAQGRWPMHETSSRAPRESRGNRELLHVSIICAHVPIDASAGCGKTRCLLVSPYQSMLPRRALRRGRPSLSPRVQRRPRDLNRYSRLLLVPFWDVVQRDDHASWLVRLELGRPDPCVAHQIIRRG